MRIWLTVLAVSLTCLAGCGGSEDQGAAQAPSESAAPANCLSPAEVQAEINSIASGFESSAAEVEAKQEQIRAVQARAC